MAVDIDKIDFVDPDGDEGFVLVRAHEGQVEISFSLLADGDYQFVVPLKEAERFVRALEQATVAAGAN
jgi:hypothetical protein